MGVFLVLIPVVIVAADAMPRIFSGSGSGAERVLRLPTRMKDAELLRASLHDYGCPSVEDAGNVHGRVEGGRIVFQPGEEGRHEAVFVGDVAEAQAHAFVAAVEHEYARHVQTRVYERLKVKARERGMRLEAERVEEDRSVVLRFAVPVGRGR
jgi:hypothetical protein